MNLKILTQIAMPSNLKASVLVFLGIIGGTIINLLGGWSEDLKLLFICMAVDFISGLIVAGVFKKSGKSETGCLSSAESWKGLCKKGMILLFVLIGAQFDTVLGVPYVRSGVIISFTASEGISIIENAGLIGLPIPSVITNAFEALKKKTESVGE